MMNVKNILTYAFVVLFIAVFLIPLLRSFSSVNDSTAWMEKREVAEFPSLQFNKLDKFPKQFNAFFNDHLGFRKYIMLANGIIKNDLFNVSSRPDKVIKGKDGWLYLARDDFNEDYYMNVNPFTENNLNAVCEEIQRRKDILAELNIEYYLFMLPSKHHVYPENLPDNINQLDTISRLDQFMNHMQSDYNVNVINTLDTVIQTKSDTAYFYDKDTHWNLHGAAFVYTVMMDELKKRYSDLNILNCMSWERKTTVIEHQGDLSLLMGRYDYKMKNNVVTVPPSDFKVNYESVAVGELPEKDKFLAAPERFVSNDSLAPKVVVMHDSFATLLKKFMATGFSESLFVWTHEFTPEIIEQEKPQIVIELMAERFLTQLQEKEIEK
ncbi:MAG: hypothetical protein KJO64_05710 [Bacteroidia bacterium]|nr:hypothetical protein [Bacteroidia bacterium]